MWKNLMRAVCALSLTTLLSCTAQQWQTTKDVLVVSAVVGVAALAATPPPVMTTCKTLVYAHTVRTVCTTY